VAADPATVDPECGVTIATVALVAIASTSAPPTIQRDFNADQPRC
jgi:hypothetical protein